MAFQPIARETDYLLPPLVQEWLPKAHLARYVVDVVEGLDPKYCRLIGDLVALHFLQSTWR